MPKRKKDPDEVKYPVGKRQLTPLQRTQQVLDISTTERGTFKSCRRRWQLETIQNLTPRIPEGMELDFGAGIHEALEAYYLKIVNMPEYMQEPARPVFLEAALHAWDNWYEWAESRILDDPDLHSDAKEELGDELWEFADLGEEILRGYHQYSKEEDDFIVLAVEGRLTPKGEKWLAEHLDEREHIGGELAVQRHVPSGRLLCPILDPEDRTPLENKPCLSGKIDLLVLRREPGSKKWKLWIYDHKTTSKVESDRGLDFDDQVTSYCYIVWRWLGIVPYGVCFNYLVKKAPEAPRINKGDKLSTAKNQVTTAEQYRQELRDRGLMLKDGTIEDEKYAEAYEAFLSRGWDRFFYRHYVTRNVYELVNFEARLYEEYLDMEDVFIGELDAYPNLNRQQCPRCRMASLCQAMEDGSDFEDIRERRYIQAPDRKAGRV